MLVEWRAGKDGLAFLTNGLGWAGLAFFHDKRAGLGWAGSGWSSVKKERARRFSLTLVDILLAFVSLLAL